MDDDSIADGSPYSLYIDGEYVPAAEGDTFETLDPATGETLAAVASATAPDVDRAVESARRGFERWGEFTPAERTRTLYALADVLRESREELARIECIDQGRPLSVAAEGIDAAARYFEFYAGATDKLHGTSLPMDGSWSAYTIREPYGISAQVIPWNFPVTQFARGVAPALAAGNAVVVKPAEQTPLIALRLGELAHEAGVPAGTLNVIPGFGGTAGEALVSHSDVDLITFTGSLVTGQHIMERAAETVTPVTLELGGKSPALVFPDADLDNAVEQILTGILLNAGQSCNASSRLLVHEDVHDELVDELVDRMEAYDLGPGIEDPDMGPLVSEAQFERVTGYVDVGTEEGATLRTGGAVDGERGYFVRPTLFDDVDNDMRIAQEEIFGPVLAVLTFAEEDEAVDIA
ncbi:MAG: aldehyde dehydrogenase, partial [Salinigranum sp.]